MAARRPTKKAARKFTARYGVLAITQPCSPKRSCAPVLTLCNDVSIVQLVAPGARGAAEFIELVRQIRTIRPQLDIQISGKREDVRRIESGLNRS